MIAVRAVAEGRAVEAHIVSPEKRPGRHAVKAAAFRCVGDDAETVVKRLKGRQPLAGDIRTAPLRRRPWRALSRVYARLKDIPDESVTIEAEHLFPSASTLTPRTAGSAPRSGPLEVRGPHAVLL